MIEGNVNSVKTRLVDLNHQFLTTVHDDDSGDSLSNKKKWNLNAHRNKHGTRGTKLNSENEKKYLNALEKLDTKEKKKENGLKFVSDFTDYRAIIHPSHIREKENDDTEGYVNLSFVKDLIKIPKDELRINQKNLKKKKYDFTYNEKRDKTHYEYINSTNEYYITKNVEEKMNNTGVTSERFFCDNSVLIYEDGMKNWNDKSRYLYFLEKEDELKTSKKKKTKLKNIRFNNILLDKFEECAYKSDVVSNKMKMENLILDVCNDKFSDNISDEDEDEKENEIEEQERLKREQEKEIEMTKEKEKEELERLKEALSKNNPFMKNKNQKGLEKEGKTKNSNNKDNKNMKYILNYLYYDNYLYNQEQINDINSSSSDTSEETFAGSEQTTLRQHTEDKKEINLKNNINDILLKVKDGIYVKKYDSFIPKQFQTDIFEEDKKTYDIFDKHDVKEESVLKKKRIELNKKIMEEEKALLKRYNYDDRLYSPGYYSKVTQQLKKKKKIERISIYDFKKKELYDKIKESVREEIKLKNEEQNLIKLRFTDKQIYDDTTVFSYMDEKSKLEEKHKRFDSDKTDSEQKQITSQKASKMKDGDEGEGKDKNDKEEREGTGAEDGDEDEDEDDEEEEEEEEEQEVEQEEEEKEGIVQIVDDTDTDSLISFEYIEDKELGYLKKKYKLMKKSPNVIPEDLRKLKFYLCEKLNKKKKYFKVKKKKTTKESKIKSKKLKAVKKIANVGGYNMLAQVIKGNETEDEDEEISEDDEGDNSSLFEDSYFKLSDSGSSQYTYSSITLSSYEHVNVKAIYAANNSNEKIFYDKDPSINVVYFFGYWDFYLLLKNEKRKSMGKIFMEILIHNINIYEGKKSVANEDLMYSLCILESTEVNITEVDDKTSELFLKTKSEKNDIIDCVFSGNISQMTNMYEYITARIALKKYINYLNMKQLPVHEHVVYFFLLKGEKSLIMKNVTYDEYAEQIICSYTNKMEHLDNINFAYRGINILQLLEFFKMSNIKTCNSLNLQGNPLFENINLYDNVSSLNEVVSFMNTINLKELILDFVYMSNETAEHFVVQVILNTKITLLSLAKCYLEHDNVKTITQKLQEQMQSLESSDISLTHLNVEFNDLNYYDVLSIIRCIKKMNNKFEKLYTYGNLIQSKICDVSFEFQRIMSLLQMEKYYQTSPSIFALTNIVDIRKYFTCILSGYAIYTEEAVSNYVWFELYGMYFYLVKPTAKIGILKSVKLFKKKEFLHAFMDVLFDNKDVKCQVSIFKNNITQIIYTVANKCLLGKAYFDEQIKNKQPVNMDILNYFISPSETELNFYYYNISREEIYSVLTLCKNTTVKYLNLGNCYLKNEDILFFNSRTGSSYGINVYKLNCSKNLINGRLPADEFIKFLSNFQLFFKINISDMPIGTAKKIHHLFFYLLNATKCKIITMNNCNLGNKFLHKVNKNMTQLQDNNIVNVLSFQNNCFSNLKALVTFLNGIIDKCKSITKIKVSSKYMDENGYQYVLDSVEKKNIVLFYDTDDIYYMQQCKFMRKKIKKYQKGKVIYGMEDDYYTTEELTEKEKETIANFFNQTDKSKGPQKTKKIITNRYDVSDIKKRKIKKKEFN